jgi:hypothetical protein
MNLQTKHDQPRPAKPSQQIEATTNSDQIQIVSCLYDVQLSYTKQNPGKLGATFIKDT